MKFFCKKYDFEIEVLTRLIWKGVEVKNVKVSVRYFPKEERVSHFHKWKDNLRISILNTFLTVGSLLREQSSPFKSALAFSIGVAVGTVPLYGLHTGIAAMLALFFRFNFVYLWLGTNISLPFFVPFLILGSKYFGAQILGSESKTVLSFGSTWFVGSLVLGLILGSISFVLVYYFKLAAADKKKTKAWTGKNRNKPGILFVRFILQKFGLGFAYFFLYFIVFYYFLFSWRTRKSLNEYWRTLEPQISFWPRQKKIYQQILVFAKTLVDRGLQREYEELFFDYELDASVGEFIKNLENNDKGIVAVASHIGGWELAMTFFAQTSADKKMLAVMHGIPGQYDHHSKKDDKTNAEVILFNLEKNAILKVKDYLAAGQVVGMMGDRPVTNSNEMRLFFGKLALFDTTPLRIALACQSQIYFVFALKIGRKKYRLCTIKAEFTAGSDKEQILNEVLQQYVQSLEMILRQHPEQWFNFFPFWSERA